MRVPPYFGKYVQYRNPQLLSVPEEILVMTYTIVAYPVSLQAEESPVP
jgi:hypothetical protein